jgi:hypothetical protein
LESSVLKECVQQKNKAEYYLNMPRVRR